MATLDNQITFVIVPGAWHKQMHVQALLDVLESRGHKTRATVLRTVQVDKPRPTWNEEVSNISNAVEQELEAGQDVCLMLHSYAGLPGCEAVNRIVQNKGLESRPDHGRLRQVVYFAAQHFPEGVVVDAKQFVGPEFPSFFIDEDDMAHFTTPFESFFTDISTREKAQPYVDEIKPYWHIPGGGALTSRDWRQAPRTIIGTTKDKSLVPAVLTQMWKEFEDEIQWIETGHSPFMVMPEYIADVLVTAAAKG